MNTPTFESDYRFETRDASRRLKGIVIVVVLHALIGYALVSGLARKGLNIIKKPLEAVVIQEVIIPPPPPPPPPPKMVEKLPTAPKVEAPPPPYVPPPEVTPQVTSAAPVIQSVATPPPAPAVIAPPPPPVPVVTGPKRISIGVACPKQEQPVMPPRAVQDGVEGTVKVQIHIKGGSVVEVNVLSGPRVFHAAVKAAIMQYKCVATEDDVTATQELEFRLP